MIDLGLLQQYSGLLARAMLVTVEISVVSILGSLLPGFVFALLTRSRVRSLRWLAHTLIAVGRNIPSIVQLFMIFYLLPLAAGVTIPAFWCAVIAFVFNGSGYVAAIVQTGLEGVPRGQWEAAKSLGLHGWPLYKRVVGPQAVVLTVGPFMNEITRQVKSSSLASTIAVPDLMYSASSLSSQTFDPLTFLTGVAVLYFAMIFPVSLVARRIQGHSYSARTA